MNSTRLPRSPIPTALTLRDATDEALVAALATNASAAVGELHRRLSAWLSGVTRRVASARRVQLHMERLEPADAMIADPSLSLRLR